MGNPLVAQRQDSTTWHSGINIIDDAAGVYDGISSGSWVEGGIAAFGVGLDVLSMALNPVGTLISYGLNWLIEHVKPLQDALNKLAGDADQIAAYAQTWKNVGQAVAQSAKDLTDAVNTGTANWTGDAADAYRRNIDNKIKHINAASTCANTIGTVVEIVGVLTAAVRMLVRDMVTQAIGDFIQDALEEVFSLGLGTPVVIAQVVAQVSDWLEKIGNVIKKLINSVEKLRPLMSKLDEIFAAIKKVMSELHLHGGEEPRLGGEEPNLHGGGEPHGTGADGTTSAASATEPHTTTGDGARTGGDGSTSPSHPADGTTPAGDGSTGPPGDGTPPDGTRPSSEESGSGQRSEGNGGCDGKGGDPVDTVSGQMITSKTDVDLPGLLPLTIRRAYASGFGAGRLFGPGWSSTLDQRLEIDQRGIRYIGDDAQVLHYPHPARPDEPVLPEYGARWALTWDGAADSYRIEDRGTGWTRHFGPNSADPGHRPLSAMTDRDGHRLTYARGEDGLPVAVQHSGGYRVDIDTIDGPAGARVAALRLHDAAAPDRSVTVVSYRYDRRGRLTGIVNSSGEPYRYEYDDANRIVAWTDRNDFSYRYVYREDGRVARGEGLGGFLNARFDYDLDNRVTTVTNSLGHATRYHYDEHNHLTRVVDPLGNTERMVFDRYHRLLSYTDPLGNTARYVRNEAGDPVRVERPDGTLVEAEYDERWRMPVLVARPGGAVWRHSYSATGNLVSTTDPMGAVATLIQDERGHTAASVEPDGQRWTYTSNDAGQPLSITSPVGVTTRHDYDAFGRRRSTQDSQGAITRYGWTIEGKLAWRSTSDGDREELFYDREDNLVESRTSRGTTRFEVGPFNLPIARTGRDGTRYTFSYDTELRLIRVTNPVGLTWDYEYDSTGDRISESDFTGRRITYRYDPAGRVVARTEQSGTTVELTRDVEGRVVRRFDGEHAAEFEYDEAGRMLRASDGTTELRYERDLLGRPLLESINGRAVRSEFDLLGRRVRRVTPSGVESVWTYTPLRREAALAGTGGSLSFEYNAGGQEITRRLGPAAALTQEFDEQGRLTAQQLLAGSAGQDPRGYRAIQQRGYRYRPDGVVTAVSDRLGGDRTYQLTVSGRVTAVTAATWSEQYTYDALGNLASAQPGTPSDTAGPRALDGFLLRAAGRSSYEYDALGRLVREIRRTLSGQRRIWTYSWNGRNQLAEATTPDGQRWRYVYDPLGRRVAKQRLDESGTVRHELTFSWDGSQLAEQWHAGGGRATATAWDYRAGTGEPVAQTSRSWLVDAPTEVIDTRFHAIVADLTGSPSELVDPAGRITWRQTMSLWGNQITVSTSDGTDCPLRYRGQYHDQETGLHYNFHRYYDPHTARYLTPDPLGLQPAPNHYTYVDNPLMFSDPLGLARVRGEGGRWERDPNSPPSAHNRSSEYPHDYFDSTHEAMVRRYTDEGKAWAAAGKSGVPVDSSGVPVPRDQLTWRDPAGNEIPYYKDGHTNLTYDHNPSVVKHWNTEGYDQTAAEREAWYNQTEDMVPMTREENGRKGAEEELNYSDKEPGPNYSCS